MMQHPALPLKNKTRRSGSEVVGYLKEKSDQEAKLREQAIKKTQQENGRQEIRFPDGHDGTATTTTAANSSINGRAE